MYLDHILSTPHTSSPRSTSLPQILSQLDNLFKNSLLTPICTAHVHIVWDHTLEHCLPTRGYILKENMFINP